MLEQVTQQSLFDYASLDAEIRVFVQEKAQSIHARLKRTAEDIIAIGQDLIEVKACLPYGQFGKWLRSEFEMTHQMAVNFMRVAERIDLGTFKNFLNLPVSVLYELAAPSTPDAVIERVQSGEISPTIPAIREAKQQIQVEQSRTVTRDEFLDEVFPGFSERQQEQSVQITPVAEEEEEVHELTEADRYSLAVDTGTTEYYYDDLRREAIKRDEEEQAKEKRDAHVMQVMGSSDSPEWYTPQNIITRVCELFGTIDTDPCSNSHEMPAVPARILYTKDDDGLSHTWTGKTYLNPPYGAEISKWTDKLVAEYQAGNVEEAVALLPARIDTVWFSPLYDYLMCNVRGRIQYANSPYNAPFPCIIVYLGKQEGKFIDAFRGLGPIMRRIA